ncbi:MAG: polysaccharide deacetylase family protein [Ginsengibacter sp.]
MENGKFVVSLDFELYWGVRDAVKLEQYKCNLLGVQKAIPFLLQMFEKYKINSTFATVGFLFFDNKEELKNSLPDRKPQYFNSILSPYKDHFNLVGDDESQDQLHFGSKLIQRIINAGQEIGSHTFSHYYCLERGQTKEDFREDLIFAKKIAAKKGIELKSLVFPRDQYNKSYLNVCRELGFTSFRGNERSWLFSSKTQGSTLFFRRPFRLLDAYFNLSGHNCYSAVEMKSDHLINIPSSRFLRPFSERLKTFESMRLKRIKASMTYAAKNKLAYHLWWHPHNFGKNISNNFSFLEKILIHYQHLNEAYNFQSINMHQLAIELNEEK